MAIPIPTEISIVQVGRLKHSPTGHPFLECKARGGTVAFWGSAGNMANIEEVQRTKAPFTIICDSIKANWPNHGLWIPERGEIYSVGPSETVDGATNRSPEMEVKAVSLQELAEWRHSVIEILTALEASQKDVEAADGVAVRISRLSHRGAIPREVGALMRAVTEMRNAAEYDGKVLSSYESLAVRNAWFAIDQWWKRTRIAD